MSRRTLVTVAAATALTAALAAAQLSFASNPVTLPMGTGNADCQLTWKKDGVTFKPLIAGSTASAYALTNGTGTLSADLSAVSNPVALANSVYLRTDMDGGFTLTDAANHYVQISSAEGSLTGDTTFIVQTATAPSGTRMPVYNLATRPTLSASVPSVTPPQLNLNFSNAQLSIQPEFAKVLNDAFGAGSAAPGDQLGTCTGAVTS